MYTHGYGKQMMVPPSTPSSYLLKQQITSEMHFFHQADVPVISLGWFHHKWYSQSQADLKKYMGAYSAVLKFKFTKTCYGIFLYNWIFPGWWNFGLSTSICHKIQANGLGITKM